VLAAHYLNYHSPIGTLIIRHNQQQILGLQFSEEDAETQNLAATAFEQKIIDELDHYFTGRPMPFLVPVKTEGSDFEQRVWAAVRQIPYGQTLSYMDIASSLGNPNAVRAVGRANACNPVPILIPCHRVIGSNQKLTGYSGGIKRKEWLLKHEGTLLI
jgi:methylated-DNA-[protein]-cysteine S-methyltransferase